MARPFPTSLGSTSSQNCIPDCHNVAPDSTLEIYFQAVPRCFNAIGVGPLTQLFTRLFALCWWIRKLERRGRLVVLCNLVCFRADLIRIRCDLWKFYGCLRTSSAGPEVPARVEQKFRALQNQKLVNWTVEYLRGFAESWTNLGAFRARLCNRCGPVKFYSAIAGRFWWFYLSWGVTSCACIIILEAVKKM